MTNLYYPVMQPENLSAGNIRQNDFTVDEKSGALQLLAQDGTELLASPVTLSLFRPATDNDNRDRKAAHLWRQAGLDKTVQKVVSLKKARLLLLR